MCLRMCNFVFNCAIVLVSCKFVLVFVYICVRLFMRLHLFMYMSVFVYT